MLIVAVLAVLVWIYLMVVHGGFWRFGQLSTTGSEPVTWPSVEAVVPARNEADILPDTLPTLLAQNYAGEFSVLLVDDASTDGTGAVAATLNRTGRLRVVDGAGPPPGWAGKVAALEAGVRAAGAPDYLLFTDADIAHHPTNLAELVAVAERDRLDLISLMARLRTDTFWECVAVPAFVYFFAQLYPFRWVRQPARRTAAAAGGCVLVRRDVLVKAGGLERIRDALIDDVALAKLVKGAGSGRIRLELASGVTSERRYPRLADLWNMVARSAYHQLRYSPMLLAGTVAGLLALYVVPPAAVIVGLATGDVWTTATGAVAWALMAATYLPILRRYDRPPGWAPALPAIALLYAAMTVDSAWRHTRGRGGAWKGRTHATS